MRLMNPENFCTIVDACASGLAGALIVILLSLDLDNNKSIKIIGWL